ncbi:uncharacterized protein LOC129266738 [Lytechinus pictus]|uniref:uncharacterized protein LOC129266738 n=1 Tax=Lytechinus pictus TaxID=7653 RepID=UPI00240CFF0F|nr:uncharacterized protein LOC129266738 [Lytechinus pictus]
MDVRYKEKLQQNADIIAEEIDAEQVCLYLNGTVLTSFEVDKIYAVKSRQERARRLLNLIMTKDTMAYQHFRYALRERYAHIVRKLDDTAVCASDKENGEFERNRVLKRRDSLILNIQTEDLVDYMKQEGTLTSNDCNRIRAGASKEDKARIMVDSLSDKGPQAYKTLSLAIRARQPQLAKIFEKTD